MTLDRFAHPALVIVDMQNDFVRVGAPLEVPESRATIPAHQALLAACRERKIPVIYTKFLAGPEWTLVWEWSPVVAPPVCCCWKGFVRHYDDVGKELDCSDICVEETARESFKRGYRTTVIADAVSSYMPDLHAAVLKNFALKFGWVSTSAEVIASLKGRAAPAR